MADDLLHIRLSYQVEGQKRWGFWSAVQLNEEGAAIIANTPPLTEPTPFDEKWLWSTPDELPGVAQFEYMMRLAHQGRELVERLEGQGWEPLERNAQGQVVRMRRAPA